jgi:CBS domain-containing protein
MDTRLERGAVSVVDVMGTEIFTLTPDTSVVAARRVAVRKGIDHLLVLDGGVLAGIVCKEDLRSDDAGARVADCMSTPVLCVGPDTTVADAAEIMVDQGVSCLPVVVGTSLVGIITRASLARLGIGTPPSAPATKRRERGGQGSGGGRCLACGGAGDVQARSNARDIPLCIGCACRVGRAIPPLPGAS